MHDLTQFSVADMLEVGAELRRCCTEAASLETVAQRIVDYLYQDLRDRDGARASALVRFFITRPFDLIPASYQKFARSIAGEEIAPSGDARCLNVLAGAGVEPEWNFPTSSTATSAATLDRRIGLPMPMVVRLMRRFGLDVTSERQADSWFVLDRAKRAVVFHLPEVRGSDYLPDDFIERYDIRSVLGFGGIAGSGDVFAVLMFTTVPVSRETAELFEPVALSTRTAMNAFHGPVFSGESRLPGEATIDELRARIDTLEQLINIHESTAIEQSRKLEDRAKSEQDAREALHRVNERNTEYARKIRSLNESLEYQLKQLEAVNQELEAFSYSVSHDLRAPLRHLSGFADLLRREPLDQCGENARKYVQYISEASSHAGKLVDDLLSFARMGRAEMRRSRVNMAALVRMVISELEPDIAQRSVVWKIGDLPTIVADPAMMALVVRNLLSNALKYTATRAEAIIEMSGTRKSTETTFCVRDNGIGFDMQYVDKLFKVFQRLHRSEDFAGSGIGLAHVQRILRRHGGRAWAEGVLDEGATFYFSLPNEAEEVADGRN
jgi:signal transduction histidine kinase